MGSRIPPFLLSAGLLLSAQPSLAQPAPSAADAADAEASRHRAEADRWAQRAALLRQREAIDRALAAPEMQTVATAAAQNPPPRAESRQRNEGQTGPGGNSQDTTDPPVGVGRNTPEVEEEGQPVTRPFGGINFGVGISFTLDLGSSDRVQEAQLVNGVVRVTDERNGIARIMLESHYLFTPGYDPTPNAVQPRNGPFDTYAGQWGHGPFVALQPGQDDIIDAVGLGWMIGFRRSLTTTQSFNFGLGAVVDPNTKILGDDILPNQPLPPGETEIRFTNEMQTGLLFLTSFSF
ncbi:hypothetical protein [Sphingosinicella sp. YJ22]|uniref:hypothetical protein n=1 Tax=Sphingosinicella sp. YJ22 TaxID=1104780 RepID=UPI001407E221|nr:hypothetical protein [Sphingosinicella sp. YJ22]